MPFAPNLLCQIWTARSASTSVRGCTRGRAAVPSAPPNLNTGERRGAFSGSPETATAAAGDGSAGSAGAPATAQTWSAMYTAKTFTRVPSSPLNRFVPTSRSLQEAMTLDSERWIPCTASALLRFSANISVASISTLVYSSVSFSATGPASQRSLGRLSQQSCRAHAPPASW